MGKKEIPAVVLYVAAVVLATLFSVALYCWFKPALFWVAGGAAITAIALWGYDVGWLEGLARKIRPSTILGSWWKKWRETRPLYVTAVFMVCTMFFSFFLAMSEAPVKVTQGRYVHADKYHILEAYLDGYVSDHSFENEEWLEVYPYLEGKKFTDEQLAVITYYGMWCGEDFPRTTVAKKLLSGEKIISSDFSDDADYSYHKLWILRAVWDGKISYKEIRNWPNGSVYLIDIDNLIYDRKGKAIVTRELRKRLKIGPLTTKEIIDVGYIPPADTSVAVKKYNGVLLYYTGVPWRIYDLDEEYKE